MATEYELVTVFAEADGSITAELRTARRFDDPTVRQFLVDVTLNGAPIRFDERNRRHFTDVTAEFDGHTLHLQDAPDQRGKERARSRVRVRDATETRIDSPFP